MTTFGDMLSLTVSDVTALKRREASFRLLFDNNPMPMWVFDAETTQFLSVNDAAVQHYGYPREAFLRCSCARSGRRTNGQPIARRCNRSATSIIRARDWRHFKADGSEIHVLTFGRRVDFDGRDGYLVAAVDITCAAKPRRGSPIWPITTA